MGRPFKKKKCRRCKGEIVNRKNNAWYCLECSEIVKEEYNNKTKKEYMKEYNKKIKEKKNELSKIRLVA